MTSELLTDATIAERERVYQAARWQREWRSLRPGTRTSPNRQPATAGGDAARHCPSPETPAVAGR